MLDAVNTRLHPSAVVTQLAEKYGVTERALWSDWQRRKRWVPLLLDLEKYAEFTEMIRRKLDGVQKAAWSIYLKASNDSTRVGALRTILDALEIDRDIIERSACVRHVSTCSGILIIEFKNARCLNL